MRFAEWILKLGLALAILTVMGQVHVKDRSLESRYHQAVNSEAFQEGYWAMMTPVTYAYGKIVALVKKAKTEPLAR